MRKIISVVILVSGMIVAPLPFKSQAQSECFLQGTGGQQIDLGHLCGGGRTSNNAAVASGVYKIPIVRRLGGIPTVMVVFNDKQKVEMLFDTGASGVAITESMAKMIGVRKEAQDTAQTAGGIVEYHLGRVASLQAGNLVRKNIVVGIVPEMGGEQGLLGQNFFGDYDVMIKEKEIELHPRR
ncbi:conserved hypothetical protein [Gloeothece citriformis PCC 7424]|uniref:Peptidase A2 domain-containing protein n=1 Tax=Gloeothece citriformis (strain PCC 7424) TaxID=65393 RepID=B7KC35_GLOC7|nr:retropepsin-like aspartic protease [Gloeothece citriformis]ACK68858.1 conserved hypothetical protein [Gloeothece citriformis PCC 7424]